MADLDTLQHVAAQWENSHDGTISFLEEFDPAAKNALEGLERRFTHPISLREPRTCRLHFSGDRTVIDSQFNRIYNRFIIQDPPRQSRRQFDQRMLRKRVREKLTGYPQLDVRENVSIKGQYDTVNVDFVVQNGRTHVIQPLSFDVGRDDERLRMAKLWAYNFADIRRVNREFDLNAVIYKPTEENGGSVVSKAAAMFIDAGADVIDFDELDDFAVGLLRQLL